MENNKDNEFDLYVRSIMENATEEVPPRVWEKCEAALGAPAVKPAPARLRWPWFLVPAVAAAVAAIVYVGVPRQGGSPALVAEVGPAEIIVDEAVPAVVPQDEVVPSALPSKAAPVVSRPAPKASAPVVSDVPELSSETEEVPAQIEESQQAVQSQEAPASQAQPSSEPKASEESVSAPETEDPFARMEWEDSRKSSGRMDLAIGGEMFTNNNPSAVQGSGIKRVASGTVKPVTQTGNNSVYAVPVSLGLGIRYSFTEHWAVGTGVQWSMMERTFKGYYKNEPYSTDIHNTLHYIGIPLNVYFNILQGKRVSLYCFAGGAFEKGISSNFRIPTTDGIVNHHEGIDGVQWSAAAGLGFQFAITPLVSIYLDPSLRYYFPCGQPISIRTQQPLMMGFEAGLRFNL